MDRVIDFIRGVGIITVAVLIVFIFGILAVAVKVGMGVYKARVFALILTLLGLILWFVYAHDLNLLIPRM